MLHEQTQESQTVHLRHLEVERDDVRLELADAVAGLVRVGRHADDFDVVVGGQRIGGELPHEGGVVDDEHADFASGQHGQEVGVRR